MKRRNFKKWNIWSREFYKSKKFIFSMVCLAMLTIAGLSVNRAFNSEEIENESEGKPGILAAMEMWGNMRTYPGKTIDHAAYTRAYERMKSMTVAANRSNNLRGESVQMTPWTEIGPWNFAGRALCLGFHPTNPNIFWVGTAAGGLWKTTTGGTGGTGGINWTYVSTGFPITSVMSIVVDPNNPNNIIIGTGEVYDDAADGTGETGSGYIRTYRGSYGIGILKSSDGGSTWTNVLPFAASSVVGVSDMVMDPNNSNIVYAGTSLGLYKSIDGGNSFNPVAGVPVMVMSLVFKPGAGNDNVLYAGCGDFNTTGAGIYKSTNANIAGTSTFTKLTTGLPTTISGKIMMAIPPGCRLRSVERL